MTMEIIIGLFAPFIVEIIVKFVNEPRLKFLASVLVCLALGVALNLATLQKTTPEELLATVAIIFTSAQTMYKLYFKDSNVQKRIESISLKK